MKLFTALTLGSLLRLVLAEVKWPECLEKGVAYMNLLNTPASMAPASTAASPDGQRLHQDPNGGYVETAKACADSCKAMLTCKHFTYKVRSFPQGGACFLLDASDALTHRYDDRYAVSGSKNCEVTVDIRAAKISIDPVHIPEVKPDKAPPVDPIDIPEVKPGMAPAVPQVDEVAKSATLPPPKPIILGAQPAKESKGFEFPMHDGSCTKKGFAIKDTMLPAPLEWTKTAEECQQRCQSSKACELYTWKSDTTPTGGCWLLPKRGAPTVADASATSGPKTCGTGELTGAAGGKTLIANRWGGMGPEMIWGILGGTVGLAALGGGMAFYASRGEKKKKSSKRAMKVAGDEEAPLTSGGSVAVAPSPSFAPPQPAAYQMVPPTFAYQGAPPVTYTQLAQPMSYTQAAQAAAGPITYVQAPLAAYTPATYIETQG